MKIRRALRRFAAYFGLVDCAHVGHPIEGLCPLDSSPTVTVNRSITTPVDHGQPQHDWSSFEGSA